MQNRIESDTYTVQRLTNSETTASTIRLSLSRFLLALALVGLLSSVAEAYPNPRYITSPSDCAQLCDTIAILHAVPEPEYLHRSILQITYVLPEEAKDSLTITLSEGFLCEVHWDSHSYTWYGNFTMGDTLRCSFEFTPLTIGRIGFVFRILDGSGSMGQIPFGFVLDETGSAQSDAPLQEDKAYGMLGVLPQYLPDTLRFWQMCCLEPVMKQSTEMCLSATLTPPFRTGQISKVAFEATSPMDLDLGAVYSINYSDNLEVTPIDILDWPGRVSAGELLPVVLAVKPLRSGLASLQLNVSGYVSDGSRIAHRFEGTIGKTGQTMTVHFVLDESLQIIAYSDHVVDPQQHFWGGSAQWNDNYRVQDLKRFQSEVILKSIRSSHFEDKATIYKASAKK